MRLNNHTKGRLHEYFRYKLKAFDYRKGWMKSDCPYCGGEKKFGINLSNNRCNCFKCGEHPSPISLVMYLESTDSFQEVLSILESGDYSGYVFKEEKVELKVRKSSSSQRDSRTYLWALLYWQGLPGITLRNGDLR